MTPHLLHADKGVRQAGITFILNFSVEFLVKDDLEGRIQAVTALATCINQETDLQNLLRASITLGNLAHESPEALSLIQSIGIVIPDVGQIASQEADADSNKQTIREINAMLFEQ